VSRLKGRILEGDLLVNRLRAELAGSRWCIRTGIDRYLRRAG
jgi:hypothetical protein